MCDIGVPMEFTDLRPGRSVEQSDIHAIKSSLSNGKYLYLLAGVHGDEVEGIYLLKELIGAKEIWNKFKIPTIIIPILNVDGYRRGTRINAHGVDLNRNLPSLNWSKEFQEDQFNPGPTPLSEPENQFLHKLFLKHPPAFAISFHSWKPVLNYNGDCKDVAEFLHEHNKYPVESSIGYATPGSLGDYLPEKYSAPVLTFECPKLDSKRTLKSIWDENRSAFVQLFHSEILNRFFSKS